MMEFTGERVIPGLTAPDLFNEHIARYDFVAPLVDEQCVLDAGCGVGYGSERLARCASSVVAFDIALPPLLESHSICEATNVSECQGNCERLPFRSTSFDVVVAFEAIEHLQEPDAFLNETARVLKPSGQLIVSTPNRDYSIESRNESNPFHVHEFSYIEFREALEKHFKHVTFFFENHSNAITFAPLTVESIRATLESDTTPQPEHAHFFVAICSDRVLRDLPAFVYLPQSGNVLRDREQHIHLLEKELAQKEMWLNKYLTEQKVAQKVIDDLQKENEDRVAWARQIEENYTEQLEERTNWAQGLDHELNKSIKELTKVREEFTEELTEAREELTKVGEKLTKVSEELAKVYASYAYRIGRRLGLAPPPPAPKTEVDS